VPFPPLTSAVCEQVPPLHATMVPVATWSEFESAAPQLAARGNGLLYQYGPPLGFLATVRADGGPRVHPFCPIVAEGGLWAYILRRSPKGADLRRDSRFALHAFPAKDVDDEFFVRGWAEATDPTEGLRAAIIAAAVPATVGGDDEQLFQLHLDRVLVATCTHRGQWPPMYERWSAPRTDR
jgi:Pyridoxamine 5'-phosphate oxidase